RPHECGHYERRRAGRRPGHAHSPSTARASASHENRARNAGTSNSGGRAASSPHAASSDARSVGSKNITPQPANSWSELLKLHTTGVSCKSESSTGKPKPSYSDG